MSDTSHPETPERSPTRADVLRELYRPTQVGIVDEVARLRAERVAMIRAALRGGGTDD